MSVNFYNPILLRVLSGTLLIAQFAAIPDAARCDAAATANAPVEEERYSPVQLLDGFGAILVGIAEPILYPVDQAKECRKKRDDQIYAGGCAFVGLLASPFLVLRDGLVGFGDVLTGGYYKLSRRVGVFDYFEVEEQSGAPQTATSTGAKTGGNQGTTAGGAEPAGASEWTAQQPANGANAPASTSTPPQDRPPPADPYSGYTRY